MYHITPGTTDVTIYVRLRDSTTGLAKTGLAYNSTGAVAYYTRPRAAAAAITLATQTVTGAHSDGGFVEIDATNAKGLYRLDLPDAVCAVSPAMPYVVVSIEFDGVIEESVLVNLGTPVQVTGMAAGVVTAAAIATDAIDADALAADAIAEINATVDTAISDASLATSTALATAQADLDILTGTDGATLATLQPNYAPATAASVAALNDLSAADVNAQVVDALATDTYAEPSTVPAATATLAAKINWLALLARNKITQTSTTQTVFADDGSTSVATSTVSDDTETATRGEYT